jgi:hypothetical protein
MVSRASYRVDLRATPRDFAPSGRLMHPALRERINLLFTRGLQVGVELAPPLAMRTLRHPAQISGCIARRNRNNHCSLVTAFRPQKRQEPPARISTRGGMQSGGPTHAPVIVGVAGTPLYHRVETPTQTRTDAVQQVNSREVWGRAARGSNMP